MKVILQTIEGRREILNDDGKLTLTNVSSVYHTDEFEIKLQTKGQQRSNPFKWVRLLSVEAEEGEEISAWERNSAVQIPTGVIIAEPIRQEK